MTTLYVTDLDGTLMRTDKTLSKYTLETVNRLIDEGMLITYATARLFQSAYEITKDIHFNLPVITRNGTVFADPIKKNEIEILQFSEQDMNNLKILLGDTIRKFGFVTSYIDGKIVKNFGNREISDGLGNYTKDHNDKRIRIENDNQDIFEGNVIYCTLIAKKQELQPLYEEMRKAGKGNTFTLAEGKHILTFEWLEFDRLKEEYFYPLFLKKEIYSLPDEFTIRTEIE